MYELPHELLNNLGLYIILGNEELLKLFTWAFIDLIIRGFELVTRRFELVTCGFELVTRGFELVTRGFYISNSRSPKDIKLTRWFELVTRAFELVTHGFELSLLNYNSCF